MRNERDTSRPLPFRHAVSAVFSLSLEGMVWTRRSLLMAVLVALPVAFAALYRLVLSAKVALPKGPPELYADIVIKYWIGNVLPVTALFYATSLVADEVERRTLTYLITRPLTRSSIFVGKFAAYLATTLILALPACVLTFFLLLSANGFAAVSAAVGDLFRDLAVLALTLLAYGALFALLGVLIKRPVLTGLAFIYGWEWLFRAPGYLPRFTLTAWLRSLVTHRPAEEGLSGLFQQVLPASQALPVLLIATAVFLYAAVRIFTLREYVLEQ